MDVDVQKNVKHKKKSKNSKRKKVKLDTKNLSQEVKKRLNPKAFSFNSAVDAEKRFRRKQDLETKKRHIPLTDRTSLEPPPVIIAVVGPPNSGKSTLINSLIKLYNVTKVSSVNGPVTIVIGKKRRITLIECNNDINSMIDIAKIADLVYILCDASFGFEMEVFEFLTICQVHGTPRIMGVLTHLDNFKDNKALRNTKRVLKHRFWTEVYQGAKLFSLSKIAPNGEYLKKEVRMLVRYVNFMKFRPLTWRSTHSYVLADRFEDLTSNALIQQNPKCDRNVCFYGYVRGIPMKSNNAIHIAGIGDTKIENIEFLPDPCPLPGVAKKRSLDDRERLIYAPFSGVGGILYDKDAVYIDIGGSHSHKSKATSSGTNITDLFKNKSDQELQLFSRSETVTENMFVTDNRRKVIFDKTDEDLLNEISAEGCDNTDDNENADGDGDDEEDSDGHNEEEEEDADDDFIVPNTKWKENLYNKVQKTFEEGFDPKKNLMKHVYGKIIGSDKSDNDDNNDVPKIRKVVDDLWNCVKVNTDAKQAIDSTEFNGHQNTVSCDWSTDKNRLKIDSCFVTGRCQALNNDNVSMDSDNFDSNSDSDNGDKNVSETDEIDEQKALLEKKLAQRRKFDDEYDNKDGSGDYYDQVKSATQNQAKLNKSVFENYDDELRVKFEGFRAGLYVRIEIKDLSCEFIDNFDPKYPILIGGLNTSEETVGYVSCNLKKNRWYPKILKTNDPVMMSVGWRRFQTVPIYSKLEDDLKYRYLKYTPEHLSCYAHFWGPITPQNTGVLCYVINDKEMNANKSKFSISATGNIRELEKSATIVKKLKLIGYPDKIIKKTAFIKGMFNSALEVAKFQGARIKTVSGIRGQIKKGESKPEGCFRATFEDKIKMSDIVFCRTWFRVSITKFYNPATNLLMPKENKSSWTLAKTTRQIKIEHGIKVEPNPDNLYTEIHRREKKFKPLTIPKKLERELPYKDKTKYPALKKSHKMLAEEKRVAVIKEPREHEISSIVKQLKESYNKKEQDELEKKRKLAAISANRESKVIKRRKSSKVR